jgi:enoyl-CoA hydratase/carnithine racemase
MTDELVSTTIDGRVARITLDRPEADNRITVAMMQQFIAGLTSAAEADVDVLMVTATGANFSVGRDQKETPPAGMTKRDNLGLIVRANRLLGEFRGISVVAFRGRALGFGSGLVVQCDLSIAADTATVGFDEIRHGFAPSIVMTYLEDYVGPKRALDLVATGRILNATEAERFGMVSRVVPADHLDAVAESTVAGLLERDRDALRTCKRYLRAIRSIQPEDRGEYALTQMAGAK